MTKPHIHKHRYWHCKGRGVETIGVTPAGAYRNWLRLVDNKRRYGG